jgi:two-component system, NtrC family, nitrogen regulation sensor histidine kinase NtrY
LKKGVRLYWILLAFGIAAILSLSVYEQKQIRSIEQQLATGYNKVQGTIRSKELTFVRMLQGELLSDTNNLQRNWNSIYNQLESDNINLFITRNDTLLYWSTNNISFSDLDFRNKPNNIAFKAPNGWYIAYKQVRGSYHYYFIYLVKNQFAYKNQYIKNNFNDELSFLQEGVVTGTQGVDKFRDIKSVSGQYLFSIQVFSLTKKASMWVIALLIFFILYCVLLVHALVRYYIRFHVLFTTAIFFAAFIWIRWVSTFYNIPDFIYSTKLFSAGVYASSVWFPSLGDLLVDSAIILWYFILLENRKNNVRVRKMQSGYMELVIYGFLSMFSANAVFSSIKSLAIDSQISFDINNIYTINAFTYFAIAVCIIQLLVVYFICRNFTRAIKKFKGNRIWPWVITATVALLYLLVANKVFEHDILRYWSGIILAAVFITFKLFTPKLNRFQQYFVVIVIISSYSAISIWHWYNVREQDNRRLFAVKQISQTDITNDYFLRGIDKKIKKDNYIKDYFENPILIKSQFEKRVRQLYFTGYLSKFDVQLFDYDTLGYHFKEKNDLSFAQVNNLYERESMESFAESFHYMQNAGDIKGYIGKFIIRKNRQRVGYLFIRLKPKLIQNENRFDELLVEGNTAVNAKATEYSYAVYKDKKLVYQSGDYPYRITNTWGETNNEFRLFDENEYTHLIYTDRQPLTIVVSKPANSVSQAIGLFSFIFTFCTVILILVLTIYILLNAQLLKQWSITDNSATRWIRSSLLKLMMIEDNQIILIRTRIQTSIVFIVFTTLIFSSYFTIKFTTDKYNTRQTDRLMKKLRNIVISIENERITTNARNLPEGEVDAFINQIADFYDTDITLYDVKGNVISSSIGKLYDEGITGEQMHPQAYFHLNKLRESQYSQNEQIGNLVFQAAYSPVFNPKSEVVGYLQLPYLSRQVDLLSEISSVVIGFINLYVLLFIIIVILAYYVSRNISYPLTLIQQRLSKTKLGDTNEPISWHRDDEIGELVKQYNSMIGQLEESAQKLAETERQGAWREIARQIAHEIKNPLTPMKLSIQHLQRAWAANDENIADKIKRTTNLLITQIDILSELANEFSSFAKMPAPVYESIDVYKALAQIKYLYEQDSQHMIILDCPKELYVSFDAGYFNRAVSNIVKNALQAIPENKEGEVKITVFGYNETIRIYVKDNGTGMTKEQADKIFVPYFSTKVSGMGLGLPIVKNMIESGGGSITFTTSPGEGTEFCITLPK